MIKEYEESLSIYIIVVSWNQYVLTFDCIRSLLLLDYLNFTVVVVDNGSQDGTVEKLQKEFDKRIEIIVNQRNMGFTGGSNVGIQYALNREADYVLLLNNDTIVHPDFLGPMLFLMRNNLKIGAVNPKIYYMNNPRKIWAAGGQIKWAFSWIGNRGSEQIDHGQYDRGCKIDFGTGCCLLIRRDALLKVGLLDNRFFAYSEDVDWSLRARKAGFEIWYEPYSWIWHVGSASTEQNRNTIYKGWISSKVSYLKTRNHFMLCNKHLNGWKRFWGLYIFIIKHILCLSFVYILLRRWKNIVSLWLGMRDGLLTNIKPNISTIEDYFNQSNT